MSNINNGFWGNVSFTQYQMTCERLLKELAVCYDRDSPAGLHRSAAAQTKSREITSYVRQHWREEFVTLQAAQPHRLNREPFLDPNH